MHQSTICSRIDQAIVSP